MTTTLYGLITLLRPKQWIKNLFVLSPLIFSGNFSNPEAIIDATVAAIFFCIASSTVYILNDYHDIEKDKQHPVKSKSRPLAAGLITKQAAIALFITLLSLLLIGGYHFTPAFPVIFGYLCLNIAYTFYLKHQPVLDIFTIAIGFVLRVYAGTVALQVEISSWMLVTTFCISLFLAAIKRKKELIGSSGSSGRKVLEQYSVELIDKYAEMSATGALVFYSLFVLSARPELTITIPLVIYGIFRYWFTTEKLGHGESPTDALYSDWQLLITIAIWALSCIFLINSIG